PSLGRGQRARRADSRPPRRRPGTGKLDPQKPFVATPADDRVTREGTFALDTSRCRSRSCQLLEQRLRLFEVGRVEALGEPAVYRRKKITGFGAPALVAAEPGKACGCTQFPELGLLLGGDAQSFAIQFLGGLGIPLPQKQLAFVSVQL